MKIIFNYFLYTFYALVGAAAYGYTTYIAVYPLLLEGRILAAHVINFSLIIFMLVMDKVEQNMMHKRKITSKKNKFAKILRVAFLGHISYKTAIYLFYIFILLLSVALKANIPIGFTDNFQSYIFVLDYGILFLIAVDVFIKHLKIDIMRVRNVDCDREPKN